ncbi:MAG: GerMN domain-containing protein [Acidobacteriaceae bacterium]
MNKKIGLIIILVIIAGAVIGVRFWLGGPEDTWICEDGQWIAHGSPRDPQPVSGCGVPDQINKPEQNQDLTANFAEHGVLIKDNPGLKPNVWYLSYEKPGQPALSVQLDLADLQTTGLTKGSSVSVEGKLTGNIVAVSSIKPFDVDAKTNRVVKLFYYNSTKEIKEQGEACSEKYYDYLLPVQRTIPLTKTPIQDTISLLIKGELTAQEKISGLSTEFPNKSFYLKSANLKNGVLTLDFPLVAGFTDGGSCRMAILANQIVKTAKQFEEAKQVKFLNPELFQP